jgi:hypothetical protein
VAYDLHNDKYSEVVEPVIIEKGDLYSVDMSNIGNRIVEMRFNLDIEEVE